MTCVDGVRAKKERPCKKCLIASKPRRHKRKKKSIPFGRGKIGCRGRRWRDPGKRRAGKKRLKQKKYHTGGFKTQELPRGLQRTENARPIPRGKSEMRTGKKISNRATRGVLSRRMRCEKKVKPTWCESGGSPLKENPLEIEQALGFVKSKKKKIPKKTMKEGLPATRSLAFQNWSVDRGEKDGGDKGKKKKQNQKKRWL